MTMDFEVSPAEIRARAEAGEPRAQYLLAANLSREGRREEAERWLQAAARGGEPDAYYTLATRSLSTLPGTADARLLLEKAALKQSVPAIRQLAVLEAQGYGGPTDWQRAAGRMAALAQAGDVAAMRQIAGLLILQDADDENAAALIDRTALRDPVAAAVCAGRRAAGRTTGDPALASDVLKRLAAGGYPRAGELARKMIAAPPSRVPAAPDWPVIAERLSTPPAAPQIEPKRISARPDAQLFPAAVPPEIVDYVIMHAAPCLRPSMIYDSRDGSRRRDPYRKSLTASLGPADQDLVIAALIRRIGGLVGCDHDRAEFLSILRYEGGGEYRAHFDWLPEGPDIEASGQRVATALLYLNEDYSGGQTHLIFADAKVKGAIGDVLVFWNILPGGAPDEASRHASLPVLSGEKWLASLWFRSRRFVF